MREEATVAESQAVRTERLEVRPGLVMVKRTTRKEDGRYLIYYEFERAPGQAAGQG